MSAKSRLGAMAAVLLALLGGGCAYAVATATPPPTARPTPEVMALPAMATVTPKAATVAPPPTAAAATATPSLPASVKNTPPLPESAAMETTTPAPPVATVTPPPPPLPTVTPPPVATVTPPPPTATAEPPPLSYAPLTQLALGRYYHCGLQEDGYAMCRSFNAVNYAPPPEVEFVQLTAGQEFACGRQARGRILCWGNNSYKKALPPEGEFIQVSAGKQHACALDADGTAVCWGWVKDGRASPPTDIRFKTVAAGGSHSCGLTEAGELRCWGSNNRGQAETADGPFQAVALGARHTCLLRTDGTVWCQGEDGEGQSSPPEGSFTQIAAGERFSCGLRTGGAAVCWGGGFGKELAAPEGEFTALAVGWDTACGLWGNGTRECWIYRADAPEPVAVTLKLDNSLLEIQQPVELFPWPGGGMAVVEYSGYIALCLAVEGSPCAARLAQPLLDWRKYTDRSDSESGMLSAALDPEFEEFPYLYVYYIRKGAGGAVKRARLSRFPVVDGVIVGAAELVILEREMPKLKHYGGAVRFGPDGMLYLGIGDNNAPEQSPDLASLVGKVIRIDVRGATAAEPYQIPEDNPFLEVAGARPEVWAYGLRNPWRMSFDRAGQLWVGDVGESSKEEVSIITAGADLGWPAYEGEMCRDEEECAARSDAVLPATAYGRDEGCAIIWGGEYQGKELRQLAGAYLFGDFCTGRVWALTEHPLHGWQRRLVADTDGLLLAFGFDAAGEVYLLNFYAPILKLETALLAAE